MFVFKVAGLMQSRKGSKVTIYVSPSSWSRCWKFRRSIRGLHFFLMYWSIFSKNVSKSSPDDMPKRPAVHSRVHPVSSTERRNACKLSGCLSSLPPSFKSIKSRRRTFQSLNSAMVKLSGFDSVGATTFLAMLPVLDADLMLVCVACAAAAAAKLRCWVTICSINCCCC